MVSDSDSYGIDNQFTVDEIFGCLNEVGRNSVVKNNLHVKSKIDNKNKMNIIDNDNNILSNNSVETSNELVTSDDLNLENLDILYLEDGILKEFDDLSNINLSINQDCQTSFPITNDNFSNPEVPIVEENPPADDQHIENKTINIESNNVLRERKRVAKPETWTRSKAQTNRMRGESYIGFRRADAKSTNKILQDVQRPARVMGPPCQSPVCKKWITRLCDSVSEEDRQFLFNDYWKNMSWDSKRIYVCSTVEIKETKQKTTGNNNSKRNSSYFHYLKVHDKRVPVCQLMYLQTLGLKKSEVHYWLANFHENNMPVKKTSTRFPQENEEDSEADLFVDEDFASTTKPPMKKKRSDQHLLTLTSFFDNLPILPSHYCRKNSKKLFLQTDIKSWSQLYEMYKTKCLENVEAPMSRFSFDKIKREKNIEIFIPKKDKCDICFSYENKQVSEEVYSKHLAKKEAARNEKHNDKVAAQNEQCHTLCCNLMAVQTVPYIKASAAYYKLKLTAHNYTVYDLTTHDAMEYWFDETQTSLSATTFASCLCDYINELLNK